MICICNVPNICILLSKKFLVGNGYGFKHFLKWKSHSCANGFHMRVFTLQSSLLKVNSFLLGRKINFEYFISSCQHNNSLQFIGCGGWKLLTLFWKWECILYSFNHLKKGTWNIYLSKLFGKLEVHHVIDD